MICPYCDATVLIATAPAVGEEALTNATIELNGLLDKYWMGDNSKTNIIAMCDAQQKCKDALTAQPASPLRGRPEIARIIDPTAFVMRPGAYGLKTEQEMLDQTMVGVIRRMALQKADAILALSASPPEQPAAQLTDEMIKAGAKAMIASDTPDGPAYTTLARACLSAALGVDGYVAPEAAATPNKDPSE